MADFGRTSEILCPPDCPDRSPGCHAACGDYRARAARRQEAQANARRRQQVSTVNYLQRRRRGW